MIGYDVNSSRTFAKDGPHYGSTTSGGRWFHLRFPYPSFTCWVIFTLEILLCIQIIDVRLRTRAHGCSAIVAEDGGLARTRGSDSNTRAPSVNDSREILCQRISWTGEHRLFWTENLLQALSQWSGRVPALPDFHEHEHLRRHLERISP